MTYDRAEADAVLVYKTWTDTYAVTSVGGPSSSTSYPQMMVFKAVEIWSTGAISEMLWQTSRRGIPKIAGTAIERLKKQISKLHKSK